MFVDQRRLRGILRHVLPSRLKDVFRTRLFGYRETTTGADWSLSLHDSLLKLCANDVNVTFPESARSSLLYHCFENGDSIEELDGFIKHAKNDAGMLLDVGAADGMFSLFYCLANDKNRAVAYEPSGVMFEHLVRHVGLNNLLDSVTNVKAAVGQSTGSVAGSLNSTGMLMVNSVEPAIAEFQMVCLDDQAFECGPPTTVKIDVEGYEGEVLRGARRLLSKYHPVLFLEFHLDILEQKGESTAGILRMLFGMGYHFESSLGTRLSVRQIATSPKAIIRFVAR